MYFNDLKSGFGADFLLFSALPGGIFFGFLFWVSSFCSCTFCVVYILKGGKCMHYVVFSLESIKNALLNCCTLRKTGSKYTASIHKLRQVMNIQRRFIHYIVTVNFFK